jgi:hypothetical protein
MRYMAEYRLHPARDDGTPAIMVVGSMSRCFRVSDDLIEKDESTERADEIAKSYADYYPLQHHHDNPEECAVREDLYREEKDCWVRVCQRV